ncbi:MAG: phosphatase [Clostridia bacterium]|nr:phosphatase [Clostridia bacterium]
MSTYIHPIADLHTHTVFSPHAYSTITENATAAARAGLCLMACTDHGEKTPDTGHHWHFTNMKILPPYIEGVRVLHGIEANVLDHSGALDLTPSLREQLDWVIASMHGGTMPKGSVEEISAAWVTVAKNPDVDMIGHCGTPQFAFDYEAVIPLFGQYGKVVEINEGSFRVRRDSYENCKRIALLCKQHGVRIAVNSDAHFHTHVGQFAESVAMLEDIGFPPELIVNNSKETLQNFLQEKGVCVTW